MFINRQTRSPLSALALLDQALQSSALAPLAEWRPRLQISETEQGVIARLELAGFSKDQIEISIEKDQVTVSAKEETTKTRSPDSGSAASSADNADSAAESERVLYTEFRSRSFSRSFSVGFEINAQGASAKMEDGVLSIELPKSEAALRKTLPIQ